MNIWNMSNRKDFFREVDAKQFMESLKKQGIKELGMSTYRDGFGQRMHTVHWNIED